jgi:hypothetical protein
MDFDASNLLAGLVASGVGFVLFTYGRRMSRPPHLIVGLCMLIYPYFVPTAIMTGGIGVGLLLLLWGAVKLGY